MKKILLFPGLMLGCLTLLLVNKSFCKVTDTGIPDLSDTYFREICKESCYDIGEADFFCQKIRFNISTIGEVLFEDNGLATDAILKNKKVFYSYLKSNDSTIRFAVSELISNISQLSHLSVPPCLKSWKRITFIFNLFPVINILRELSSSENGKFGSDILLTQDNLYKSYNKLVNLFDTIKSLHAFIDEANCEIKSNQAILSFMQQQIAFSADIVINEFEQTYKDFVTAAHEMFARQTGRCQKQIKDFIKSSRVKFI